MFNQSTSSNKSGDSISLFGRIHHMSVVAWLQLNECQGNLHQINRIYPNCNEAMHCVGRIERKWKKFHTAS